VKWWFDRRRLLVHSILAMTLGFENKHVSVGSDTSKVLPGIECFRTASRLDLPETDSHDAKVGDLRSDRLLSGQPIQTQRGGLTSSCRWLLTSVV